MVSLVTLLLGIPPSILVTILLDEYASKWPGKVESDDEPADGTTQVQSDTKLANIIDRRNLRSHKADNPRISYTANAIRKASIIDSAAPSSVTGDAAMYTYCNGETFERLISRTVTFWKTTYFYVFAYSLRLFNCS